MPKTNLREKNHKFPKHGTVTSQIHALDPTIRNGFVKTRFFVSNETLASTKEEDDITLEELKNVDREKEEIIREN